MDPDVDTEGQVYRGEHRMPNVLEDAWVSKPADSVMCPILIAAMLNRWMPRPPVGIPDQERENWKTK